jgi:hypothetical protein
VREPDEAGRAAFAVDVRALVTGPDPFLAGALVEAAEVLAAAVAFRAEAALAGVAFAATAFAGVAFTGVGAFRAGAALARDTATFAVAGLAAAGFAAAGLAAAGFAVPDVGPPAISSARRASSLATAAAALVAWPWRLVKSSRASLRSRSSLERVRSWRAASRRRALVLAASASDAPAFVERSCLAMVPPAVPVAGSMVELGRPVTSP